MERGSIEREIYVEASPEVLFAVVSRPEHIREWWSDEAELGDGGFREQGWEVAVLESTYADHAAAGTTSSRHPLLGAGPAARRRCRYGDQPQR